MGHTCGGPDCEEQVENRPFCSTECEQHAEYVATTIEEERAERAFEKSLRG